MLRRLAREVAVAAEGWERADIAAGPPPEGIDRYYDSPETLRTLWADLADAHDRGAE